MCTYFMETPLFLQQMRHPRMPLILARRWDNYGEHCVGAKRRRGERCCFNERGTTQLLVAYLRTSPEVTVQSMLR